MKLCLLLLSVLALGGCAAEASNDAATLDDGDSELKASECPVAVDVLLTKPSIASDASLQKSWAKDMAAYENDPQAAATAQLTLLSSHVAKARSQTAVKLHGTRGAACFYKTVDAQSGQP